MSKKNGDGLFKAMFALAGCHIHEIYQSGIAACVLMGVAAGMLVCFAMFPKSVELKASFDRGVEHGRDLERCEAKMGVWREDKCWPRVFPIDIGK